MIYMKILYYRVGMDTGIGGCVGPIFDDNTFEYIPIPDYFSCEERKYANIIGRSGKAISNFVPPAIVNCPIHWDPDFSAQIPVCCEGTTQQNAFTKLEPNDYLVHYAGLSKTPLNPQGNIDLYIIGLIKVKKVIQVNTHNIEKEPINAHTRRYLFIKNLIQTVLSKENSLGITFNEIIAKAQVIDSLTPKERTSFYNVKCETELVNNPLILNELTKEIVDGSINWVLKKKPACLTSRIKEITIPLHAFAELFKNNHSLTMGHFTLSAEFFINTFAYLLWCFTQFILVIGDSESRLLTKAFKISERSVDKRGIFLNRVKEDIAPLLGVPKDTSLQRKNLRFIPNAKTLNGDPEILLGLLEKY